MNYLTLIETQTKCPQCQSENIYQDGNLWICPECAHEWSTFTKNQSASDEAVDTNIYDAHGNKLTDGDSVTIIKELKIKGATSIVKIGTKVKNIRLTDGHDGHNIACKIEGIGSINLKSEFVKKS